MKLHNLRRQAGIAAAVIAMSVSLAACGEDEPDATDNTNTDGTSETSDGGADASAGTFGPGCALIPKDGKGSFDGMVKDPVATAASNNPLLETLVAAVGAVEGLGDTLNSQEALTVFAPVNDAFAAVPAETLTALLDGAKADGTDSALAKILSHHVVGGKLDPEAVVGQQETLVKDKLTIEGDAESGMTVSDGKVTAKVLCGNIPTANATVYVIDSVLTTTKTD